MRPCEVEWCVALAEPGKSACKIHLARPDYRPPDDADDDDERLDAEREEAGR